MQAERSDEAVHDCALVEYDYLRREALGAFSRRCVDRGGPLWCWQRQEVLVQEWAGVGHLLLIGYEQMMRLRRLLDGGCAAGAGIRQDIFKVLEFLQLGREWRGRLGVSIRLQRGLALGLTSHEQTQNLLVGLARVDEI